MDGSQRRKAAAPISSRVSDATNSMACDRTRARCCMHYRDGMGGDVRCCGQTALVALPAALKANKTYQHASSATDQQTVAPLQVAKWRTACLNVARVGHAVHRATGKAAYICAAHFPDGTTMPVPGDGSRSRVLWHGGLSLPVLDARTFQVAPAAGRACRSAAAGASAAGAGAAAAAAATAAAASSACSPSSEPYASISDSRNAKTAPVPVAAPKREGAAAAARIDQLARATVTWDSMREACPTYCKSMTGFHSAESAMAFYDLLDAYGDLSESRAAFWKGGQTHPGHFVPGAQHLADTVPTPAAGGAATTSPPPSSAASSAAPAAASASAASTSSTAIALAESDATPFLCRVPAPACASAASTSAPAAAAPAAGAEAAVGAGARAAAEAGPGAATEEETEATAEAGAAEAAGGAAAGAAEAEEAAATASPPPARAPAPKSRSATKSAAKQPARKRKRTALSPAVPADSPKQLLRPVDESKVRVVPTHFDPQQAYLFFLFVLCGGLSLTQACGLCNFDAADGGRVFATLLMLAYRTLLREQPISAVTQERSKQTCGEHWKLVAGTDRIKMTIDATEVASDNYGHMESAVAAYSSYKGRRTVKFLVGISTSGAICFVSRGYHGRITDVQLTSVCGLYELLEKGDAIMADRGFLIANKLAEHLCTLHIGHTRRDKATHFTPDQLLQMRRISNLRIHVEVSVSCRCALRSHGCPLTSLPLSRSARCNPSKAASSAWLMLCRQTGDSTSPPCFTHVPCLLIMACRW